ncbi:MAG: hypothetical protein AAAFM81_15550, partial [Pseudomonadota bacterium]
MIRKILIAMIAMSMIVLLALLVRESRSISAQFYIDYSGYVSTLRQAQRDHETLMDTLDALTSQAVSVPNTVNTLAARLEQSKTTLEAPPESLVSGPVQSAAARYVSSVNMTLTSLTRFVESENQLAEAVKVLREDSPEVVRTLRDRGNDAISQNLFGLTVDVLDNATGKSSLEPKEIGRRLDDLVALAEDNNVSSRAFTRLIDAAAATPLTRAAVLEELAAIDAAGLEASAQGLYSAVAAMNASVTSRADRARLLLGGLSAVLLLGIAMIGLRLRQSNQALNETNEELE